MPMKKIKLSGKGGGTILVDDEDFVTVSKYKWYWEGNKNSVKAVKNYKTVTLHRLIMRARKGQVVDHINHNVLDNQKKNLRFCTMSQNAYNRILGANNTSGYKGVHWSKRYKKFTVHIGFEGKFYQVGSFTDKKQAALAYNEAAKKYHKEFAYLNVI